MQRSEYTRVLSNSVLVLNRFYMAVHVISARRAFIMLYRDTAEVIHLEEGQFANYDFTTWCELSELRAEEPAPLDDWLQAVNFRIQVPRVIRLLTFDRAPRPSLRFNRRNLFARDNYSCQYCGISFPPNQLSMDHVMPRSRGGETTWENIVCSCLKCNTKKGGRTPKEARMRLIRPPSKPAHNPLLALKMENPKYESWQAFLPKASKAS